MAEISTIFSTTRIYKDLSLTFTRNPVTNDVAMVTDAEAVKRSIKLLLLSRLGETPFFPNFGSRIHTLLFEPVDPITTVLLNHEIIDTLTAFEPRVQIQQLSVIPNAEESRYDVTLVFTLVNQIQPITLSLFLTRLR